MPSFQLMNFWTLIFLCYVDNIILRLFLVHLHCSFVINIFFIHFIYTVLDLCIGFNFCVFVYTFFCVFFIIIALI